MKDKISIEYMIKAIEEDIDYFTTANLENTYIDVLKGKRHALLWVLEK